MTRLIAALSEVADRYDTAFCDLWGCLHDGQQAFAPAVEAMRRFRDAGARRVALLTNAPRPAAAVARQCERLGVTRDAYDVIVTSGDAAQDSMLRGEVGTRVFHLGPEKDDSFFTDVPGDSTMIERVPLEEAEGIVATGLFDDLTETPDDYRMLLTEAARRDLPMLCANPDIVVDYGDQRLYCAGALAALYEEMGGRTIYVGKPHAPIYDLARRRLALPETARVLAIGDGIGTDVEGAARQGIDMLFISGGLAFDQFGPDPDHPDPVRLRHWLRTRQQAPVLAMGRLR